MALKLATPNYLNVAGLNHGHLQVRHAPSSNANAQQMYTHANKHCTLSLLLLYKGGKFSHTLDFLLHNGPHLLPLLCYVLFTCAFWPLVHNRKEERCLTPELLQHLMMSTSNWQLNELATNFVVFY